MEICKKPNKFDLKKVQERLGENLTFALVQAVGQTLETYDVNDCNFLRVEFEKWKHLTRKLIQKGKFVLLESELERIMEEVADGQWTDFKIPKEKSNPMTKKNLIKAIGNNVRITEIAKQYGLKFKGKIAVCPFHTDKAPSLGFSDEKGVFNCFGCGAKGDVLTFIKMMEELNGNKGRS